MEGFRIIPEDWRDVKREADMCEGVGKWKRQPVKKPEPKKPPGRPKKATGLPTWERRRAQGKCVDCELPPMPGRTRCKEHAARAARYAADQRAGRNSDLKTRRAAQRLCPDCGVPSPPRKQVCDECSRKRKAYAVESRERARRAGLCTRCKRRNAEEGRWRCARCLEERRREGRLNRAAGKGRKA